MPFEVKERRRAGSVLVLELAGRLTMGANEELDTALQGLIAKGERGLLLDCAGIPLIDSQGIQSLVRAVTSVEKRGGKLKLLKLTPRVREVLDLTRLLSVVEAFEDEEAALRTF
ncbi:MAG: STAS domain-containing protein [Terriglobia bacterium]